MKLLHLDSSILGANSVSRSLSSAAVERFKAVEGDLEVTYRDLAADPVQHLTGGVMAVVRGGMEVPDDPGLKQDLALGEALVDELVAADIVVIGVAFYNFTIATQLKAWIDRIAVAGKTFRYTENGPEGLLGDKRIVLAIARGGFYGAGSPAAPLEHAESYLRGVFGFLGVSDPEVIVAEGLNTGPDQREAAIKGAIERIATL
tara:strand:- start:8726 stop:9334 length:609 start_codon:yes stop_codon:yes gene_type:complete